MNDYQKDVEDFMVIGGHEVPDHSGMESDQANLYMDLIEEEFWETKQAFLQGDLVEVADGLADMVWVIMGLASTLDMDFNDIWKEVKRSNMSKFPDGVAIRNPETGKIMKPDTFSEPDLASVLGV